MRVAAVVTFGALFFALVEVQVFTFERFARIAIQNRMRPVTIRAPRGTIYDRNGRVIAENVVGYEVLLMPAPERALRATLDELRPILGLTDADTARVMRRYRRDPHRPALIRRDASARAIARLQERRYHFANVLVREYPKRRYPAGEAVSQVVGYLSEISERELALPEFRDYEQGRWIGKAGVERSRERDLGGTPGYRYAEVDALGNIKRWLPEEMGVPPIPGRDLQLHLDLDLQRYVHRLFQRTARDLNMPEMQAAIIAVDPQTGGVLALHSTPNFDPNVFIGGIDPEQWQRLTGDEAKPMLNRAVGTAQPPGSTFKLATAAVALEVGAIEPEEYMPVPCGGGMSYQGRYARCWGVHGSQDLIGGIKHSCDVYFYQVGIRVGFERFLDTGTRLGFAERTGIDLPSEMKPIFPAGPDWWERRFGYEPNDNEIMSLSIGQGAVTLTPAKLVHLYLPLLRGDGRAPELTLARQDSIRMSGVGYDLTREQTRALRKGMRRVLEPGGTAWLSRLPYWDFLGKTGTAENPIGPDHAWFVGVGGPSGEPPEIAAAMVIMHGLHGYVASGPIANAINFYLNRAHGRPYEPYPTPRERLPRGLDVDWAWLQSPAEDPPPIFPPDTASAATAPQQ